MRLQSDVQLMPEQASTFAEKLDTLYLFLVTVGGFFSLLIFGLVFFFAIKYRRRNLDEWPVKVPENKNLEIFWSVLPFGIAMIMFFWGARLYFDFTTPPSNPLEVYGVGKQWMWKFQHPEGQREINALHVPVNQPVRVTLASEDVIHSFYVPAFRVKMDVVPGRYTSVWFEATKAGRYNLFCAEYCGTDHSRMIGEVVVLEAADYEDWLAGGASGESMAASGEKLFQKLACNTCHSEDATARGPSLRDLYGRPVQLADGRIVTADNAYLRESILNPTSKIVAGFEPLMPTYQGQLDEEDVLELLAFIRSQSDEGEGEQ